jgi:hypothetical protein
MKFTELYQEMVNSAEIIRALTANVSQAEAQIKPAPEAWSLLEVICHLHDVEREDFREHLDFILHPQGREWHEIDPQGWITSRRYNEQDFDEIRAAFFEERRKSLNWLTDLTKVDWTTSYESEFGLFSAEEMFACWVAHDNLHIRQLAELQRTRIERITNPLNIAYAGDW